MIPDNDLRSMRILHLALAGGCIALLMIFKVLAAQEDGAAVPGMKDVFLYVGAASMLIVALSFMVFRNMLKGVGSGTTTQDAFAVVRSAMIVHWAMIEGVCFLNGIFFFMGGSVMNMGFAIAALAVLTMRAPTRERLESWCKGQV